MQPWPRTTVTVLDEATNKYMEVLHYVNGSDGDYDDMRQQEDHPGESHDGTSRTKRR